MQNTCDFFAYGTLQIPEVMRAVTRADFLAQPARIEGYARYRLNGLPYPGLRAQAGLSADGILYRQVDAAALHRLDAFEDDFYRRECLQVRLESGALVMAWVYVIPPDHYGRLLREPWDLDEFRRTALPGFIARCETILTQVIA